MPDQQNDLVQDTRRMTAPSAAGVATTVLRTPFTRRAKAEAAYCLVGFPVAAVGFVLLLVLLIPGTALTVSLVGAVLGLSLLVTGLRLARALGAVHRRLAAAFLGERVAAPQAFRPGKGALGRLDARLRDVTGWRSVAYVALKLPVGVVGLYAVGWWINALINVTMPLWWAMFRRGSGTQIVTPLPFGGSPHIDTFAGTFLAALIGVGCLLVAPWFTRLVVAADRRLVRALLGPRALDERVRDLEETRALAVDDSAALLRRLERDLHDGAQVRLVAVAMSLDMAKEKLGDDGTQLTDSARVRQLVDSAHRNATDALAELRDLARGLHPAVLDDGLPGALASLAARSSLPVELSVDVPVRPTAAIETIAYYCAAELLANVIKHSGAQRAVLAATGEGDTLSLGVTDDGRGGARADAGSGLAGLVLRVRTVDGSLEISSPEGGPTLVTVTLPLHA
jgi:signal transduction histidine kinase